jgi:hypothetical protein
MKRICACTLDESEGKMARIKGCRTLPTPQRSAMTPKRNVMSSVLERMDEDSDFV